MSLPPSSPRLPSPPPPAEIQFGPKSPLMGPDAARQAAQIEQTAFDTNAKRRIHPGTKAADMAAGPPLVALHELDSAFQLQEHLAALHYYHTASHTSPITRETAKLLATPPSGIDKTLWLYELCRFLIAQCNSLIVGFLFDAPPCSAQTCPEMRASEWQFLCAVHDAPKNCCAIDYCCHTLDWAANVVTNPKIFPSRFVVDAHDKNTALKNLVNVFRRLHRIFAHAWFQHRGVFWAVESQTGLYVFFKTVCDVYDLLPAENYKLPPEAEGLDSSVGNGLGDASSERRQSNQQQQHIPPISIAKPPGQRAADLEDPSMSRTNTRRHIKSSPSTGSAVPTVLEADEDDGTDLSSRLGAMRISGAPPPTAAAAAAAADEELELASIPVIVEHKSLPSAEQPTRPSSVIPPVPAAEKSGKPVHEPAPVEAGSLSAQEAEAAVAEAGSDPDMRPADSQDGAESTSRSEPPESLAPEAKFEVETKAEAEAEAEAEANQEETYPAGPAEAQQGAAEQTVHNDSTKVASVEQGEGDESQTAASGSISHDQTMAPVAERSPPAQDVSTVAATDGEEPAQVTLAATEEAVEDPAVGTATAMSDREGGVAAAQVEEQEKKEDEDGQKKEKSSADDDDDKQSQKETEDRAD
ncbi:hypothetical protein N656DRAFT_800601 [Canariomyces notabilis]|uniref:Mob1 family protein n=1 Tax=Canariomyces notabilis TaxID=2074819 RepID=A0AAN6TAC0_9PEZI|nr:hypothetical protein N656DRAFT_800601 [Canariomyces arenarius]